MLGVNHELQVTDLLLEGGNLCLKILAAEDAQRGGRSEGIFAIPASPPAVEPCAVKVPGIQVHTRNLRKDSPVLCLYTELNEMCIRVKSCFWVVKRLQG